MKRRRMWPWMAAAVVVATAVGALAWWLGGDTPAAVDVERALGETDLTSVGESPAPTQPDDASEEASRQSLSGRWVVDTSRPFDGLAGRGTFVGYVVAEELVGIGATRAVGRTPDVDGWLRFDDTRLVEVVITADLTTLTSDDARRDRRIRDMLGESATARFELDEPIDLGEVPALREVIELQATGQLTIREVTRPVTISIEAGWTQAGIVVGGSTTIMLEEFGVAVPSASIVLSASDEAVIEWQLHMRRE